MSTQQVGTTVMAVGAVLFVCGLMFTSGFSWFGRLPGDMHVARGAAQLFIPVTSMVLVSVALTSVMRTTFGILRRMF